MIIFRLHDQNTDREHCFTVQEFSRWLPEEIICGDVLDPVTNTWSINPDSLGAFVEEIESEYGVHDVSGSTDEDGTYVEGYTSYEIPEGEYPGIMERYREWFAEHGYTCGPYFVRQQSRSREDV